jgi:hypothetical protein
MSRLNIDISKNMSPTFFQRPSWEASGYGQGATDVQGRTDDEMKIREVSLRNKLAVVQWSYVNY